ncbi:unnamed protein product [Thlaspi arvense]|uniref:Uncharacterized protein n=1 Tax=Thlaspi arvense TaxID=13288 RepID=A0AAU9SQQ9_THLAR|nr:unnamed protein product [Thlaspi arvense]
MYEESSMVEVGSCRRGGGGNLRSSMVEVGSCRCMVVEKESNMMEVGSCRHMVVVKTCSVRYEK